MKRETLKMSPINFNYSSQYQPLVSKHYCLVLFKKIILFDFGYQFSCVLKPLQIFWKSGLVQYVTYIQHKKMMLNLSKINNENV